MVSIVKLSNGIPVIMERNNNVKSVSTGIYLRAGSRYEEDDEKGIAHIVEHMLFKGTKKRTVKDIFSTVDSYGGHMNAFTSKELVSYYITILADYIPIAIDVLSDIYINSTFPNEELVKEKKVIIEEIRMYEDIPEEKIHDINTLFTLQGSKFSTPILGTEKSVSTMSYEKIVNYWKHKYTKDNMVISVAGAIDKAKIIDELEKKFSKLRSLGKPIKDEEFIIQSGLNLLNRKISQVHLCFNTKGKSYLDKDRYSLSMISNILAGSSSSRLFHKIREERGLAYSLYSYLSNYKEGGIFTIYAGTTKTNYNEVIELIRNEFLDIKNNCITQEELELTKRHIISDLILSLETTKSRMSRMGMSYMNYGEFIKIEDVISKFKKLTLKDIKRCAEEIFDEKYYSLSLIGDIKKKDIIF